MAFLARKYSPAKWGSSSDTVESVPADAITICLKTTSNSLSVWKCQNIEDDAETILKAVAGTLNDICKIDVVYLEIDHLNSTGMKLENTPDSGMTFFEDLKAFHHDIVEMNYKKLGILSTHILDQIKSKHTKQFTRDDVKKALIDAYNRGLIQETDKTVRLIERIKSAIEDEKRKELEKKNKKK